MAAPSVRGSEPAKLTPRLASRMTASPLPMALENPAMRVITWPRRASSSRTASANAAFDLHIASVERAFGEPRRFERHLHVHVEIDDVGDELGVGLRLVPSAHNAEPDGDVAFAHEGGNDGVQRPLVAGERIGFARLEIEALAAIVEREADAGGDHAGSVSRVVALDQRDDISFLIDGGHVDGLVAVRFQRLLDVGRHHFA